MNARRRARRVEFELAGGKDAPAAARRRLTAELSKRVDAETLYEVNLLLSELVTNAVRHGGAGESDRIEIDIELRSDSVRVCVTDPGDGFARPAKPRAHPGGHGGNGLPLLQELARAWDVEGRKPTRVWFEVELGQAA
ncbi:MAG: hypothetical protein QOD53_1091 [Thermoleophilaceae bacterium]|jgi:anti-sigma regulatory factor (Ser/Thr protein kinase)|nr:hypothetical protein [Thermoleophilaceae bacterium]